ncbi:hypothetical protein BD324DRAFT_615617 [Kockovaella imperatae]|uniref:Magnesium transporter NIPA-domain-containing protein n=1 Tax=Kockovaella imperatae TaxID=4999 RepID=A0A1Y1UPM0_9TREE|nr:hypothetical protein BD324DRAFT_615617 [Kockovaella imperatae]ORX39949.1 hypothetical protein BD324DRAFT_615617 [Kockovaella imperatae]
MDPTPSYDPFGEDGNGDTLATFTSSALDAIATAINSTWDQWGDGEPWDTGDQIPGDSGTIIDPLAGQVTNEGSYVLNTLLGLVIVLIASVLNAFGLNLTKLDHMRQQAIPRRERKKDYLRLLWLAGMGTYIISQLVGSPLALRYLRPDWVAPLGSSSLIFNFLFANWLVGTPVTATDIRGTVVIVLGVILIMIFSSINHGLSQTIDIETLNDLWTRAAWLSYFALLIAFTALTYLVSHFLASLLASRASFSPLPSPTTELPVTSRAKPQNAFKNVFLRLFHSWNAIETSAIKRLEIIFQRTDDARITWLQGIGWAVAGGSLAGMCLVFTKVTVKTFSLPGHPLVHPSALITLLLVIISAILQIVCLNRALVCADTVVVVPLFYAGYTVFGFINALVFFDQARQYARWVLGAVFVSIAILITGVVLLSLKSSAKAATDPYTVSTEPATSIRLRPQMRTVSATSHKSTPSKGEEDDIDGLGEHVSAKRDDVLWEAGSVSDGSDNEDQEKERRGLGGGGHRGERRGLLDEEGEDGDLDSPTKPKGKPQASASGAAR